MDMYKVYTAMGDFTRHGIYQFMYNIKKEVTVNEVAEEFSIHPNVARSHLTKLEAAHLIQSTTQEKEGRAGRPSRTYSISTEEVSIQFPVKKANIYEDIILSSISDLGDIGKEAFQEIGAKIAQKQATEQMKKDRLTGIEDPRLMDSLQKFLESQSLNPEIDQTKNQISLEVFNCPFRQQAKKHSELVCSMHSRMLKEIIQTYLGEDVEWKEEENMLYDGERTCLYFAKLKEKGALN